MNRATGRLFVGLQYLLPRYWLTSVVYRLARVRWRPLKNGLIRGFVRMFAVDTREAAEPVPDGYRTFNEFFVRDLVPGARPVDPSPRALVSPVDGTVSEAGPIADGMLLQAKGMQYSLEDLLATDLDEAEPFTAGRFMTLYLAPHDYHRVHAPFPGRLTAMRYVPGELFSVNDATAQLLRGLFVRNERLVCHFATDAGPCVLIFIGAINVGSITTPWTGEIRPRRRGVVSELDIAKSGVDTQVAKGDLLGWFNMGSSVIVLLPRGACELADDLTRGRKLRMGEALATLHGLAG